MITVDRVNSNRSYSPDFSDPFAIFIKCHRRLENHLRSLERACEHLIEGTRDEKISAYFAIDLARSYMAGPHRMHIEDEERSLFPRLQDHQAAGLEALAALGELESQHRTAEQLQQELDSLIARMPRDGSTLPRDLDYLNELVAMLASLYRSHMNLENEFVYPLAARLLTRSERQRISAEMRARRNLILK